MSKAFGTPYHEALSWIEKYPGTGSASSLAKLLLSLWNSGCSFSYRECIDNLDDTLAHLAVRVIKHFSDHGEDEDLVRVGYRVHELYPRLWDAGQAMREARAELRRQWELEQEEAIRANPDGG
jgi:hypothetical protein